MKISSIILVSLLLIIPQKEKEIIGTWNMCKMGGTSKVDVSFNACPTIEFKENNQGIINDKYKFQWKFKEESIQIIFKNKNISQYFTNNSIYKLETHSDTELKYLKLVDENGKWLKMSTNKK